MRVAFILREFPATSQTFVLRQVTGLLDLGHEVDLTSDRVPPPGPVHRLVRERGLVARTRYAHAGDRQGWLGDARSLARLAARRPSALRLLGREAAAPYGGRRALLRRLRALEGPVPDVVHAHFGNVGLRYRFVGGFWDRPLLVSFYGHDFSRVPRQRGEDVYAPLFREASRIIVLSEHAREQLEALGCPAAKIRKVHLGVDPQAFSFRPREPKPAGEAVCLLTVARLTEKKGLEYAIRAVGRLLPDFPELRYEIIGDGPLRDVLERRAADAGDGRIRFLGARPQEDVIRAMGEADLFLLPSVTAADGDQEGTPTVLIEAASRGLPVLSTRHAGIPEVIPDGEAGFLVPERDMEALTERLRWLLRHPERWAEMGRAGRRHIEAEFDAGQVCRRLVTVYEEVLRDSRVDAQGREAAGSSVGGSGASAPGGSSAAGERSR